ncbi:MAG: type II toxin-antitoxin system VapC family toxin [Armatimonadetes bacterium]|nr:type II toxin-antitoxin system VapC family toxin [Armatimonadota bacterium]PIU65604.1 MAG: hypothetical protein COS85_08120 [Armatimonadetes bacterium CG07_land_8_20_14_0_80_59_28]PIY44522.1 MAG: hypothetical protein COZ05_07960 [Armatimonadetes bacterium CG_4_10_14_3_um_filter_59_10]
MNGTIESVWDTNAVIEWLQGDARVRGFVKERGFETGVAISQITRMELLARPGLTEDDLRGITTFLVGSTVVQITPDVERHAIDLRRSFRVKLPDAIIAATAETLRCPLVTADRELERKVSSRVNVLNPHTPTLDTNGDEQKSGDNSVS